MDPQQLLLAHLDLVKVVVRFVARRHRLGPEEAEELLSSVELKLVENDYAVLRQFRGRSSLKTYLTAVVHRHCLDQRIAQWGRWRPSACARRWGPAGVLLDRLVTREGMTLEDAVAEVRARFPEEPSASHLYELGVMLPRRTARRFLSEAALADRAADTDTFRETEVRLEQPTAKRVERALVDALRELPPDDRAILRLRFHSDLQVSQIARLLGLDQRVLYRRLETIMRTLRRHLERQGITREQIVVLLGHSEVAGEAFAEPEDGRNLTQRPSL